jgi:hypothetical protein
MVMGKRNLFRLNVIGAPGRIISLMSKRLRLGVGSSVFH